MQFLSSFFLASLSCHSGSHTSPYGRTETRRLVPDITPQLFRVDDRTVVKACDPKRLAEAEALKFVRFKHLFRALKYIAPMSMRLSIAGLVSWRMLKGMSLAM